MNFAVSANTDVGTQKDTNQDSLLVRRYNTDLGELVFAVLCDGMGGLAMGEVASATLITAFSQWADTNINTVLIADGRINTDHVREQWLNLIRSQNEMIKTYGKRCGVNLGTTVTAALIGQADYFIVNVGDTRAYKICNDVEILTKDQTLVAKEVSEGKLTPEQAEKDPRRSVLLQCVGASNAVFPEFFMGSTEVDTVFMLCSDGFRHEVTQEEIAAYFSPAALVDEQAMFENAQALIEMNKSRMERDNITVALIRSYQGVDNA